MRRNLTLTVCLGAALLAGACEKTDTSAQDVLGKTKEAAETAAQYISEQIDAYQQKMQPRLDELDARIAELKARANDLGEQGRAELETRIDQLETQRQQFADRLDELAASSEKAWEDVKTGLDQAWHELDSAVSTAVDRYAPEDQGSGG